MVVPINVNPNFTSAVLSKINNAISGTVTRTPDGYDVVKTNESGAQTAVLGKIYTVTYNYSTNGGTSATTTSAQVATGEQVDLTPTATKSGWTFVGWNTSSTATTKLNYSVLAPAYSVSSLLPTSTSSCSAS